MSEQSIDTTNTVSQAGQINPSVKNSSVNPPVNSMRQAIAQAAPVKAPEENNQSEATEDKNAAGFAPIPEPETREDAQLRREREAILQREQYEQMYPVDFNQKYPHLKEQAYLEGYRDMVTMLVKQGYISPVAGNHLFQDAIELCDENFYKEQQKNHEKEVKQRGVDIQLFSRTIKDKDVDQDKIRYLANQKLENYPDRTVANWLSKTLDDPKTLALLEVMGFTEGKGVEAPIDYYDPNLTEAIIVAKRDEVYNNVKNGRLDISQAAPELQKINEALSRKRSERSMKRK